MSDPEEAMQKVLDVRQVGADYEEHQEAGPLDIPVDLHNFKKFPVVDEPGTHKPSGPDTRPQLHVDNSPELPDYSGPFRADLHFTDFSNEALVNMLAMSDEYYRVCVQGWAEEVSKRYGADMMREIQAEAWQTILLPQLQRMIEEWMAVTADEAASLVNQVTERSRGSASRRRGGDCQSVPSRPQARRPAERAPGQPGLGQPRVPADRDRGLGR